MRRLVGKGEDEEETRLTAWEWEVKKTMSYARGEAVAESKGGKQLVQEA
jgi:hypothetical protein